MLNKKFFNKKAEIVAKELLGKILIRKINGKELKSRIVETEAYYGSKDPASRAYKKTNMSKVMWNKPGTLFIYNVHKYWMFNIVTEEENIPSAVLIRALEPLNFEANLSGPGRLTSFLNINKDYNDNHISKIKDIKIIDNKDIIKIESSNRIGVTKDLKKKLRFFIKDNNFVSK